MEKVICDICGSEFDETLAQCPICGCAKKEAPAESAESTPVKGGRFSKSNVRRRLKPETGAAASDSVMEYVRQNDDRKAERTKPERSDRDDEETPRSNHPLLLVVILLLLAIISVSIYIVIAFSDPADSGDSNTTSATTIAVPDDDGPCSSIQFTATEIKLDKTCPNKKLTVIVEPVNTLDTVAFTSSNPGIVFVDADGNLVALKKGTVTITATCGSRTATITVVSEYEVPTTPPTTPPPTTVQPTLPQNSPFEIPSSASAVAPYKVKVIYEYLNVRKAPDTTLDNKVYKLYKDNVVTVIAEFVDSKRVWGLTEYGWISLETEYVTRVAS